jgi:NAD(P)-dependent dehydrogenase (short-subunit alcohol dehydrogenase family)
MQVSLHGRVILVTGAAQGIGQSCARLAARSGAAGIMLTDRNRPDETERLVGEDGQLEGTEVGCVEADLRDKDAPLHIVEACLARFGRVDGLVNAAGLTDRGSLAAATPALWDLLFTVNAKAPSFLMQHCIADMTGRQAPGSIVNILSMNIHCGADDLAIYSASKAALALITRNAAQAHRFGRIRINGINVGWADTPGERRLHTTVLGKSETWLSEQGAKQPFGRLLAPEDVARLAIFLLSDASLPMTGALVDQEQWVLGGMM